MEIIYRITDKSMIEEYFSGIPEGERPWDVWAADPHNTFSGGLEDLDLFIKIGDNYAGWLLSQFGLEGNQPFTPDDEEGTIEFLKEHGILWNPEYAVDYPEPWDTEE
jgi:hypothetical protein